MAPRPLRRKLPAVLDSSAVQPLLEQLLSARGKPIVIDASAVERMTVPAVQVLMAARATWADDSQSFRIVGPSEPFARTIQTLSVPTELINLEGISQ